MWNRVILIASLALILPLQAQELEGRYHFRLLSLTVGAHRTVQAVETAGGTLEFQAGSSYTHDGETGSYIDYGGGSFRLSSPFGEGTINARLGARGDLLLGAATESTGRFALFVAARAPAETPVVSGVYQAVKLEVSEANSPQATTVSGALDASAATIILDENGQGTISDSLFGELQALVSAGGDYIVGAPSGRNGIFVATRAATASLSGLYWTAEFAVERDAVSSSVGSLRVNTPADVRRAERMNTAAGSLDYRGAVAGITVAHGVGGTFLASSPGSLLVGVEAPGYAGVEPFLHPHGIVNAASLAPVTDPVAPGSFVSLYGSGLQPGGSSETSVTVNGLPAETIFTSPGQVNVRLPNELRGSTARFLVRTAAGDSNSVLTPLAASSPAIFSADFSGTGAGLVTHADFSLVTPASPAARGEIILLWATGLGLNQPAPRILMGGVAAPVLYSGVHPDFPGLYQINVTVPAAAPLGGAIPLALWDAQGLSDTVEIPIGP